MRQYQLDAFTDRLFAGNPAAVLLLDDWLPDDLMLAITRENNFAETAFANEKAATAPRDAFPKCERHGDQDRPSRDR